MIEGAAGSWDDRDLCLGLIWFCRVVVRTYFSKFLCSMCGYWVDYSFFYCSITPRMMAPATRPFWSRKGTMTSFLGKEEKYSSQGRKSRLPSRSCSTLVFWAGS